MSKVICDVCGTTYPETAAQCPICGSAKNSAEQTAAGAGESAEQSTSSYAYVKGGRFSKKNVRKRSKGKPTTAQRRSGGSSRNVRESEEPNNTGLVIVVVLLMIAIVAVVIYLILPFFPKNSTEDPQDTGGSVIQTPGENENVDPQRIACTGIQPSNTQLELAVGESWTLTAQLTPVDTTDSLAFISQDPTIAAVDAATGEVTMLSEGQTVIVIICGEMTAECTVRTPENPGNDDPTNPGDDPVVPGEFNFEFNTIYTTENGDGDTTISSQGKTWKAYKSSLDIDPALITWTSDNESIAKVENGIVTAVGPGTTKIHATYNGVTYTCVVRCAFEATEPDGKCALNLDDVTIKVGETFTLKLKDASGYNLSVTWKCDTDGVTIEGNKITGAVSGTHKVYCEYEGEKYTCIVRVK